MPKASIDKNTEFVFRKNDIWTPRKLRVKSPEKKSLQVKVSSYS